MKLSFRPQAESELIWFAHYYRNRFPEGRRKAQGSLKAALQILLANPLAGQLMEGVPSGKLPVLRSPFVLIYTVEGDTVDILRVWDARSNP